MTFEHVLGKHLLTHRNKDFFFVQVGAHDGIAYDPLYGFVKRFGWQGILVEPQAKFMAALRRNYEGSESLEFQQVAISSERGSRPLYKVREVAGLPKWTGGLASFNLATILSHRSDIPNIEDLIETEEVKCLTLSDLFESIGDRQVDLLQVDVEGYDFEVIRTLDFERWQPTMIHFEHGHFSTDVLEDCLQFLIGHGYTVALEYRDAIAHRVESPQSPS